jgi:hypothetical protein
MACLTNWIDFEAEFISQTVLYLVWPEGHVSALSRHMCETGAELLVLLL